MGFKDEFKFEMQNVRRDLEKEVRRAWKVDYEGHCIEVMNQIKEEVLLIDGKIVDKNKRKYLISHMIPYVKLSGILELEDGTKHVVSVKIGGYVSLNCIIKVDNEVILNDSLKLEFLPWEHKDKIVPFIQAQVETHHKVVNDLLPDDEYLYNDVDLPMTPGLFDTFVDDTPTPFYAKRLLKLFIKQMSDPTTKTRKATYEKIIFDNIASYGEEFVDRFQQVERDESRVQQEALWLLEHAAHREVVKFAVTVLGCTDCEKYKELLFTIGMHEEFTSYVVFALKNGASRANDQIWQLARQVHGWGKIAAVEQLEATSPKIKQWLLIKGCENTIMDEYLAYTCADKGDLEVALEEDEISRELYDGANRIIQALLHDDAFDSIEDYQYASIVLSRFVHHARVHCNTVNDFYTLMRIYEFINADEEVWEERFNNQWQKHERDAIRQAIQPLINDHKWSYVALDMLQSDYDLKALEIARFYELDVTDNLFELLKKYPTNGELYLAIMATNNDQHIKKLCTFAESHLSLSSLSNDEQDCLQYLIQDLHEYEGVGLPLIQAALESDNGSLQYQALTVLEAWQSEISQQPSVQAAIKNIASTSKDKEDRKLAKQLM